MTRTTTDKDERIAEALQAGMPQNKIAKKMHVSKTRIQKVKKSVGIIDISKKKPYTLVSNQPQIPPAHTRPVSLPSQPVSYHGTGVQNQNQYREQTVPSSLSTSPTTGNPTPLHTTYNEQVKTPAHTFRTPIDQSRQHLEMVIDREQPADDRFIQQIRYRIILDEPSIQHDDPLERLKERILEDERMRQTTAELRLKIEESRARIAELRKKKEEQHEREIAQFEADIKRLKKLKEDPLSIDDGRLSQMPHEEWMYIRFTPY